MSKFFIPSITEAVAATVVTIPVTVVIAIVRTTLIPSSAIVVCFGFQIVSSPRWRLRCYNGSGVWLLSYGTHQNATLAENRSESISPKLLIFFFLSALKYDLY